VEVLAGILLPPGQPAIYFAAVAVAVAVWYALAGNINPRKATHCNKVRSVAAPGLAVEVLSWHWTAQ